MTEKRNIVTFTLSASLFSLAGALLYFTIQFSQVATQIPAILASINQTSEKIKPVINEVIKIRDLVPPITNEITELRKQIPSILEEVKQTRELVPPILDEIKKTRESIPAILIEVKKTREAIPAMLVKGEKVVKEGKQLVKETSENAVTGVFTGIIKAPFKMIGGIFGSGGKKVDGVKDADQQLALKAADEALSSDKVDKPYSWSNPDSGNNGVITIRGKKIINDRDCRLITFVTNIVDNKPVKKDVTVCLNNENKWEVLDKDEE